MRTLILALTVCSLFSCTEQKKEASKTSCCHNKTENNLSSEPSYIDSLKTEIMIIHDEVMPQTGHLMKLRNSLKEQLSIDSSKNKSTQLSIDSLKLAHDKMMEWMQGYDASHDLIDTSYFIKQQTEVKFVNEIYKTTIYSAEQKLK